MFALAETRFCHAAQLLIIRNIDTLQLDRIINLFRYNILQERLIIQTIQAQSSLK